ncbi:hypothetical protein FLAVO9R_10012 [Flavobacterium sp. 9R]|nr:hypothetical protein FLAVO9R_10012 [Flavobacterium sp. 9R]
MFSIEKINLTQIYIINSIKLVELLKYFLSKSKALINKVFLVWF